MHLRVTGIRWLTDGMDPVKDCNLPLNVLLINAPTEWRRADFYSRLAEGLEEVYGFRLRDFGLEAYNLDGLQADGPFRQAVPWHEAVQAVLELPWNLR